MVSFADLAFNVQGQPALLYLIPCTLCALWTLAWLRGELPLLWRRDVAAEALEHARKAQAPDRPDEESGALCWQARSCLLAHGLSKLFRRAEQSRAG